MIHAGRHRCKHTYSYFDHTTGHTSGHAEEQASILQEKTCAAWSRTGPNLQTVAWHWLRFARWHQISPYYGGAVKTCQRKLAIQSNSSDLLISEVFPWRNGDKEGARQLVLVSHWWFFICGGPPSTTQQRVYGIQWHFKKVLVYSSFSISCHVINKTNASLVCTPGPHKSVGSGKCIGVTPKQMQHPIPDSAENTNQYKCPSEQ